MKHVTRGGFADVAVLALVALVAAGSVWWFRARRGDEGLRVEARYKGQVHEVMVHIAARYGQPWTHENIRIVTPDGERIVNGVWHRWIESRGEWHAGFWQGGGHVVVVRNPHNGEIDYRVLVHELWHEYLSQQGVPAADHHRIMRQYGVWGSG